MIFELHKAAGQLGIQPGAISQFENLSGRHGHQIWRIHTPDGPRILKWFPDEGRAATEIGGYRLLMELGVATLPVYGMTHQSILLEDLQHGSSWRLGGEEDMMNPRVGGAIAGWYRNLHERGSWFLDRVSERPPFLSRESDILNRSSILKMAMQLGPPDNDVCQLAADSIRLLRDAESRLSVTLSYNDFHWSNLALSRHGDDETAAIVFDYHLLGMGTSFSDCRNVIGSLKSPATEAFWRAYGNVDPREETLDRPLSTLAALVTAVAQPRFPAWAEESRTRMANGSLAQDLRKAIGVAKSICEPTT